MTIYTKKGDKGKTSLFLPKEMRVDKDSLRVEAIGAIDELDSYLGVAKSSTENRELIQLIEVVQRNLLTTGSSLAGSSLKITKRDVTKLEKQIDEWDGKLPKLSNFILPGGTELSAHLHYCRSLARRAERRVVSLSKHEKVAPQILMFVNRLSDYFFQMARFANFISSVEDEVWKV